MIKEYIFKQHDFEKKLFYTGNIKLLEKQTISIVGTRRPSNYTKSMISQLANKLSKVGLVIVSGGAMGVDIIAHTSAGYNNTIMVAGTGLDIYYPKINKNHILQIQDKGLIITPFDIHTPSLPRNFVIRNELIVRMSDILIVAEADINSGSASSIKYALKLNKTIYVLPHRIGESQATNQLLQENKAKAIYDIDEFIAKFGKINITDDILKYFQTNPNYEEAINKYGDKVFEYELLGKIKIVNGKIIAI
jgi:DNA processing protein